MKHSRHIILDRDGVINQDSLHYIKSPSEWMALPGSLEAIARLNQAGFLVAVATNQSGLHRKLFDEKTLNDIHGKMREELKRVGGHIDTIFICPHLPEEECVCRKPAPGLLYRIATHYQLDLSQVYMVGDTLRDVGAAKASGANPIFVHSGCHPLEDLTQLEHVPQYANLAAFVDYLLKQDD